MNRAARVVFPRLLTALFVAGLSLFVACNTRAQGTQLLDLDSFPRSTLEIQSGREVHRFDIWVAATPAQQTQGLMFVRDLPENRGMLFLAKPPRVFNMWMKNTFIPLDMVFIAPDGRIAKIVAQTTPHSLETVSSTVAVGAVLELKGGEATRRALAVGDRVSWKAFQ